MKRRRWKRQDEYARRHKTSARLLDEALYVIKHKRITAQTIKNQFGVGERQARRDMATLEMVMGLVNGRLVR